MEQQKLNIDFSINITFCYVGLKKIYEWLLRNICIHNLLLFGADFGLVASTDYTSSKIQLASDAHYSDLII